MADEQAASSADQLAQAASTEPAGNGVGETPSQEAQQPQSNETPPGTAPSVTEPQQDNSKYAGLDLNKLPEDARAEVEAWADKRERDQMRYITQKSQEIADVKNKAKYYDEFKSSQEYNTFKSWYGNQGQAQPAQQANIPQSNPVADKFSAAGFSPEEAAAMASAVRETVQDVANTEKQQIGQQLNNLQYQQQVVKAQQDLENLGRLHPDIYDMLDAGVFKPFVEHYCVRENQPLEVAYMKCKESMVALQKQGQQAVNQRVREKKNAVSATPTPAGDADIVYVDSTGTRAQVQKRIDKAAFDAALEGRKIRVRVKKT